MKIINLKESLALLFEYAKVNKLESVDEMDAIRVVGSSETLKQLEQLGLIEISKYVHPHVLFTALGLETVND